MTIDLKHPRILIALGSTAAIVIVLIAVGIMLIVRKPSSPIDKLAAQTNFSIFYPKPNVAAVKLANSSAVYNKNSDGISYDVYVNGKEVFVSEQATPDVFSQPGVYDFKLNQAHEYDSFQTAAGEVDLTRPSELDGQTLAWVNSKGTLLLAQATQSLSDNQWRLLFNNMPVAN